MTVPRFATSEQPDYTSAGSFVKFQRIFRERLGVSEAMAGGRTFYPA